MEGWQVGLIVVIVVGLAVIAFGALRDRRLNERRRREMLAPPQRDIPKFSPDSPTPNYLSELQARRPPPDAEPIDLSEEERTRLRAAIDGEVGVTEFEVGYASADLVTDSVTGWSVLHQPGVLVSAAAISALRELLGILEKQVPTGRPLVVAAPSIGRELLLTFEVNHIRQVITILPVFADDETLRRIAAATGATVMSHTDLQSGFFMPSLLGSCASWISTPTHSYVLDGRGSAARMRVT